MPSGSRGRGRGFRAHARADSIPRMATAMEQAQAKTKTAKKPRCAWVASGTPLDVAYHDEEWGVPSRDDRHLFEMLTLEGAQAGLSWSTILKKREGYRRAFTGFDPRKVARFDARKEAALLRDAAIVRHPGKIASTISNARAVLAVQKKYGSLAAFVWRFVDDGPVDNRVASIRSIPPSTPVSKALSKALLAEGFRFVGPTTCYAFMQAVGMVNDHELACFRHAQVRRAQARRKR